MPSKSIVLSPAGVGAVSVAVAQDPAYPSPAQVAVRALVAGQASEVARFPIPDPGGVARRFVGAFCCPGAGAFEVEIDDPGAVLQLQQSPGFLVNPAFTRDFTPLLIADPLVASAEIQVSPGSGGPVCFSLAQPDASPATSDCVAYAKFPDGQWYELGRARIPAPASGLPGGGVRTVAYGDVPGASAYRFEVYSAEPQTTAALQVSSTSPGNLLTVIPFFFGNTVTGGGGPPSFVFNPPITATYVAVNGDDITGQRGNPLAPFATINAALAVSQSGDTILIAPGTYAPAQIPPVLQNISLRGMGARDQVFVSAGGPDNALEWTPVGFQQLAVENLTLRALGFGFSLLALGDQVANLARLSLVDVNFQGPAVCEDLASVTGQDTRADTGLAVINCNGGRSVSHVGDLMVQIDDPTPAWVSRTAFFVEALNASQLQVLDNARVITDPDSVVDSLLAPGPGVSLGSSGVVQFAGRANQAFVNPFQGFLSAADLSRSRIQTLTSELLVMGAGGKTIDARNATIGSFFPSTPGPADELVLDTRGGVLENYFGFAATPDARWRRDPQAVRILSVTPGIETYDYTTALGAIPGAPWPSTDLIAATLSATVAPGPGEYVVPTLATPSDLQIASGYAVPVDVYAVIGSQP